MKISVALCTWNGEKYLAEQLASIFAQTLPVNEIVICDDKSSDNTISIIQDFQSRYPGIISLVQNPQSLQARKNFEQAIGLCTGDAIFLCDQDDRWVAGKVQATIDFFETHPKALGIFSNGYFLGEHGVNQNKTIWGALSFSPALQQEARPENMLEMLLKLNNFVTGAAFCIKKEAKAFLFPFFCALPHWHDYWIALKIATRDQLYFLDEKLIHYRVHESQQTGFSELRQDNDEAAFKEAVWSDHHDALRTDVLMPFIAKGLLRCWQFQKHLATTGQDTGRFRQLAALLASQLTLIKQRHFKQLGFIEKKKLFVKSCIRPGKYFYFNLKDRLGLLLG
ncbi:MAG: glycosyltransferase [Bacteroidota bacterium]